VAIWLAELKETVPLTEAPPTPATANVKVALVIVVGFIAVLKVALTVVSMKTFMAALAGLVTVIVGPTRLVAMPVVKLQTQLAVMA